MKFSIIIPVYNRPDEVLELLETLVDQTYKDFEVLIIEDGSTISCEEVVQGFKSRLDIHYFFKENGGQGFARNYGFERATGDYYIVFDSDCLIPGDYLNIVNDYLKHEKLDAYGGPDAAHESFNTIQKAINYSMTSFFTTGGIRGRKKNIGGAFHPRSFNMGISKEVYQKTNGYLLPYMGEDLEFSIRVIKLGYKTGLITEAFVYHKRRTSFRHFYKQLKFFGKARINVSRFFPDQVKLVHLFPVLFLFAFWIMLLLFLVSKVLFKLALASFVIYYTLIFFDALWKTKNVKVATAAVATSFIQLYAYGVGFLTETWKKVTSSTKSKEDYTSLYK